MYQYLEHFFDDHLMIDNRRAANFIKNIGKLNKSYTPAFISLVSAFQITIFKQYQARCFTLFYCPELSHIKSLGPVSACPFNHFR